MDVRSEWSDSPVPSIFEQTLYAMLFRIDRCEEKKRKEKRIIVVFLIGNQSINRLID
jgi:hypothetical protein